MGGTPIALCIIESPIEMHDLGVPHDLGILNIKNKCTSHSECCTPKLICWTGIVQLRLQRFTESLPPWLSTGVWGMQNSWATHMMQSNPSSFQDEYIFAKLMWRSKKHKLWSGCASQDDSRKLSWWWWWWWWWWWFKKKADTQCSIFQTPP